MLDRIEELGDWPNLSRDSNDNEIKTVSEEMDVKGERSLGTNKGLQAIEFTSHIRGTIISLPTEAFDVQSESVNETQ
ncbi:MAG: hypothetical protein ACHQ1H_05105 [Nitrososphaerales archaeon]